MNNIIMNNMFNIIIMNNIKIMNNIIIIMIIKHIYLKLMLF